MASLFLRAGFDVSFDRLNLDHLDIVALLLTYNHAPFIRRSLKAIFAQKFSGSLGIVVHDDCSTDGTLREILNAVEEASALTAEVHILLASRNGLSRGVPIARLLLNSINSSYIAMCEGDDAWGDPNKLQVQYDFLSYHRDYSSCGHRARVVDVDGAMRDEYVPLAHMQRDISAEALRRCECHIPTCTLMLRGNINFPASLGSVVNGDNVIWSSLGHHGPFRYISSIGDSLYTKHPHGVWSLKSPLYKAMAHADTWLQLARYYFSKGDEQLAAAFLVRAKSELSRITIK